MIVITGAAGFIGSCLVARLNELGFENLLLVDDFSRADKNPNWQQKRFAQKMQRDAFPEWFAAHPTEVSFVFHLGARTDTTEFDKGIFDRLNVAYSKSLWELCTRHAIPFVYASSAATYGNGELGYADDHQLIPSLQPLNPYGWSKQEFDLFVLKQTETPPKWAGLKFFNVYGPNEYHKARMASVIFHAFNQIRDNGSVKLFRSHRPDYRDGWQLRDFIYVKDVVSVCVFLMQNNFNHAIFNLGTGKARSFYDLAAATFRALDKEPQINFIDIPEDIRDKYQYFTEANMQKLIDAGYRQAFSSLEEGVTDYVQHYLTQQKYY